MSFAQAFHDALDTFVSGTHQALIKAPAIRQEMVLVYNLTSLSNETIVLQVVWLLLERPVLSDLLSSVWNSSDDVLAVAEKRSCIIYAASDYFYLVGNPTPTTVSSAWLRSPDQCSLLMGDASRLHLYIHNNRQTAEQVNATSGSASYTEIFWSGDGRNITVALPRRHDVSFRTEQ